MHEGLSEFITALRSNVTDIAVEAGSDKRSLFFILDQQLVPDVLIRVYSTGEAVEPVQLFRGSDFEQLADTGPICFSSPLGSALQHLGETLCQEQAAGIAVITSDASAALMHARALLKVNDGSGGQSLITYYRADMWPAMAMTSTEGLFGPWHSVYSPAPRHLGMKRGWLHWQADNVGLASVPGARYSLAPSAQPTYRTLRWLYWLDSHYLAFKSPTPDQLPMLLSNLELLVEHGINEGRWLLRLAGLISSGSLAEQDAAMAILHSDTEPFLKVEHLQALTT